jgi:restriction system protein
VAIPDFQSLMRPCLVVHQDGQPHPAAELRDRLAEITEVTDEDRKIMLPSRTQPVYSNRVAWAVTHLAQAGLLDRPSRGITEITDRGREVLAKHTEFVNIAVLMQFPEYVEFRTPTRESGRASPRAGQSPRSATRESIYRQGRRSRRSSTLPIPQWQPISSPA